MGTVSPLRVGIFVFDDAEELDVAGPYEVLTSWTQHSKLRPEVLTFSPDGQGVRLAKGLRIVPDRGNRGIYQRQYRIFRQLYERNRDLMAELS